MSTIELLKSITINEKKEISKNNLENIQNSNFTNDLKKAINEIKSEQKNTENLIEDLTEGKITNLHQAALSLDKAEINMKLMLEVRNKALNAYKELSKTTL